ncbi:MAG: hypothetical protein LBF26_03010 [Puniceicoccales bacterium]|jgi:hypothetical protein|nr:hypothetical protein [Puniceicoccales bacterium]
MKLDPLRKPILDNQPIAEANVTALKSVIHMKKWLKINFGNGSDGHCFRIDITNPDYDVDALVRCSVPQTQETEFTKETARFLRSPLLEFVGPNNQNPYDRDLYGAQA